MRVLFSSTAGFGHVLPLLPLARAFAAAGHAVAVATGPTWQERLRAEPFAVLRSGLDEREARRRAGPMMERIAALPVRERRPRLLAARFGEVEAPARVDELRGVVRAWRPDLLVHEPAELAAPLVAAEAGLASVQHSYGRQVPAACFEAAARVTASLWRAAGLEPERLGGVFRGAVVDICPPSLAPERPPRGVPVYPLRAVDAASPAERESEPLVYVTLGTVFNEAAVFRLLLEGLAGLRCRIVATVGHGNDPVALGPVPANVRVERFVPQAELLPRCSLVVGHGGSGSMLGALAHGVPLLVVPQSADQFDNAQACVAAGVARALLPGEVTSGAVRAQAEALLGDVSYAERAAAVAAEIAAMPSAADVVARLATAG